MLYVPSAGRADDRIARGPLSSMTPERRAEVTYVVPSGQLTTYRVALNAIGWKDTGVVECPEHGIAATRRWIGEYADRRHDGIMIMMDDDIGMLVRRSPDDWRLRAAEPQDVEDMLGWVSRALDTHAHVSISAREGNNRIGVGDAPLVAMNTRTLRLLAYRTDDFLRMEHGRVPVMEDFDVNLQLLRAGHSNACAHYWAQGQRMTGEAGGCSTYRDHALHEAAARRLAELHPGLVRLRQKQNKTDRDGFGTRTEVTIEWKRAHAEGQRRIAA